MLEDTVRYLGVVPFVPGFGKVDQVDSFPSLDSPVEGANAFHSYNRAPVGMPFEGSGNLGLFLHRLDPGGPAFHRILQAEPVLEPGDGETAEIACRRHERTIECVCNLFRAINCLIADEIYAECISSERFHKPCLDRLSVFFEDTYRFFGCQFPFLQRQVFLDDFLHSCPDGGQILHIERMDDRSSVFSGRLGFGCPVRSLFPFMDLAVQAARKGIVDDKGLVGVEVPHGFLQDEAKGADIGTPSVGMVVAYEFHLMRHHHPEVEFFQLMVDKGGEYRHGSFAVACRHAFPVSLVIRIGKHGAHFFGEFGQGCPFCHIIVVAVVDAADSDLAFFHVCRIFRFHPVWRNTCRHCIPSASARNGPVTDPLSAAICSGVPWATILPPPLPPSGPMSIR